MTPQQIQDLLSEIALDFTSGRFEDRTREELEDCNYGVEGNEFDETEN